MTDISAAGMDLTAEPPPAPDVQLAQATPETNQYLELVKTPETPAAPAQPANPYVDVLRQDATRMRATALSTQGSSPDAAAKAVALSKKTGMPTDMVERNLPEVATQQKANEYADLLRKSPKMADWLAQDPINAKVMAEDDVEKLGFVEWTVNELYRPYLTQQASSNLAGVKVAVRKTMELDAALGRQTRGEYLTPFDKQMIAQEPEIRDAMRGHIIQYGTQREEKLQAAAALPELPVIKDMQKAGEAGDWGGVFSALMKDPVRAAYVISLQGAAMLPWQIAGYRALGPAGAFATSFGLEYMGAVEGALKESGVNTQDPSQIVAAFGNPELMAKIEGQAATKASVIAAFDTVSIKAATVPLGFGKKAVTKQATNIAAQIGVQGALGGAGEAVGSVAAGMKVDPFAVISEVIGEMGTGPAEVAGARWGQAVRQDATREQWEKFQALAPLEQYATGQAMLLDKLVAQANDSKLATTSPEKLQEFIAGVSAQDATVFVPADTVMTYMQDMTGLQAEAFLGKLGITAGELSRIRQTNEDFAIPLAMYITGASEAHAAWKNDIRTEVDGFSVKQAQEWEKAKASELKALQERFEEHVQSGVAPEPQGVVYQQVLEMAKANGYTNEAAARHAALYAARYAARAARNPGLYTDALDAFEKAGPGTGMRIQTVLPEGTRALGPDVLDSMLDSLRSGKEPLVAPPAFAHIEARKEAAAAELATVLPEPPPTAKDAKKAAKKAAADRTAAALKVFKEKRQELADALAGMDLNIAKMSNAQIRAAIQKEIKGQTLHQPVQEPSVQAPTLSVGSAAFKRWFGDSKVVDENGEPLVVYHGSNRSFSVFRQRESRRAGPHGPEKVTSPAFFFTPDRDEARMFAKDRALIDQRIMGKKPGRPVARAFFLKIESPLDFGDGIYPDAEASAVVADIYGDEVGPETWQDVHRALDDQTIIDGLMDAGYDGVRLQEDDGAESWAAFDAQQIKSATGNRGTFDPEDANVFHQEARGSITFGENATIIQLFQARDMSTLAHKSGHLWLSELEFDARDAGAGEQPKADWQTVLDFVGSPDGFITREQHELFARAFETYLMEGKAPSEGLRGVFRQFRNWLVSIYRNLANLQAPISPEMRQVFDRLLAADEEIAAAQNTQGLNPVFVDAKSAGMTDAEFAAYNRRATQVVEEAEQAVLEKTMASIRRERTKEVAAEKAKIRAEVTDELMAEPGQAALHLLRKGKLYAGETPEVLAGAKLSRNALVEMLGEAGLQNLPAGIYADEGIDPDVLAQTVGLGNGLELVERLMQIEAEQRAMRAKGDNRTMLAARIAEETQKRLTESLGDPLNDGSIEAEAMAAVHSDKQGALMSTELKVLARKAKQPGAITLGDIEDWAANTIAEMSVYQATQHAKYQRAERMAGQAVQRALIKGDFLAAFKAKQDQLVNFALYREAKKAAEDVDGIRKLADRYASAATIKSMDQAALEQIHALLEAYDFKKRSGTLLAERTTFAMWAAEQVAAGFEVIEPPRLGGAGLRHYSQMTMEEIRGVGDTMKQMAHIGRWKQSMIDDGKRRDFEALVDEAVETAGRQPQRGVAQVRRGTTRLQDVLGDVGSWFRSVDAALLKMETLFEWLDGDKTGRGVFSRFFQRVADAQVQERDMMKDLAGKAKAIYDKVPAEQTKLWSQQHVVEDLGAKLNKSQMIAVALNMGNASNMQKLLEGEKWAEPAVRAMLDKHLTKEEWRFVQDTWDLIDSLWPATEALERRVNGVAPPKVEAVPVETRFGALRGGYYPMAYDKAADVKADRIASMGSEGLFDPEYRRASTRAGSSHKRVEGFNAKVLLELKVIGSHLNEVAHDLAFREVVMDGNKFLSNDKVREAIRSAIGPEYEKQALVWLKAVANEWAIDRRGLEGVDKFLQTARANTAIVGMGFRVSTMLSQTAGFSNSVQRLGSASMLAGLRDFYRNPFAMKAAVHEKSGEMRNRANDLERDIRLALQRMEGKASPLNSVRRFAFRGIALFDAAVSLPTWMGAYNKGLREGMSEKEAVAYGDKMVRDTQGAGSVKDLSAIQRGGEALKLFAMFYSYFNVYYNRQRGLVRDFRSADSFSDYMNVVAEAMWLMVVPTLLAALLSGQGPDDDEEWWAWASRNVGFGVFSGIPWVRDISGAANNLVGGKNFGGAKLSPIEGIGEGAIKLFKDAANLVQGKETSKGSIKNTFNMVGLFAGLPTGQLGASTQFVWDALVEETQEPEGLLDWMKGLAYGPKPKK